MLYHQTLRLEQVDIFPKKKKEYSEITLGKEAIENVQAFSLNEVLQQLPGQVTMDFNNNEFKNEKQKNDSLFPKTTELVQKLNLTASEMDALEAFLMSLKQNQYKMRPPQLPNK